MEYMRSHCGELLASCDDIEVDSVAGIPDSGTAHTVGYSSVSSMPLARPFIEYTPAWPRSSMPTGQMQRDMTAKMKLTPVQELVRGKHLLLTDNPIVQETQPGETTEFLYESGAKEIHVRPVCPPVIFGCKYPSFSRSKSGMDLITCRIVRRLGGDNVSSEVLAEYADPDSERYQKMCKETRQRSNFTFLRYHRLDDMITSIGLDKCKLCVYCWDDKEDGKGQGKKALSVF